MKKICFVTTVSLTMDAFILDLVRYLQGTGDYDISLACKEDPYFEARISSGIHFYPIPIERGANLSIFKAIQALKLLFQKEQFDLVQYSTPNASFCASVAAKQAGVPVRLYCQWGIAYVGFSGLKRSIFKKIEKMTCSSSTVVEPDSHGNLIFSVQEGLYTEEKAHVVGDGSAAGVDLQRFDIQKKAAYRREYRQKLHLPEGNIVYGFVGRLDRDKGINELLTAYRQVMNEHTNLMIIGPEDKKDTLDQELYQWSLQEPSILYTGSIKEVPQYLSCMDMFILPSYREGFGSVLIEAEAMGLPVITTDIPGPTEAMQKDITGLIIPRADVKALADAMRQLSQDRIACAQLGKNGVAFVSEHFNRAHLFKEIAGDRDALISAVHQKI